MKSLSKLCCSCLIIFACLVSCHNGSSQGYQGKYYNREKWTPLGYYMSAMKGRPQEVKVLIYTNLSDTTMDASGEFMRYAISGFDAEGKTVFQKTFEKASNMLIESLFEYDKNGRQVTTNAYNDSMQRKIIQESKSSMTLIADSTFEIKTNRPGSDKWILRTSKKGEMEQESRYSGVGPYRDSTIRWYKGDRMIYGEIWEQGSVNRSRSDYYYSSAGYLDSSTTFPVVVDTAEKRNLFYSKTFYVNNKYGDPVSIFESYGFSKDRETRRVKRMKYVYDEKGNWIKRMLVYDLADFPESMKKKKHPGYELTIREIKY